MSHEIERGYETRFWPNLKLPLMIGPKADKVFQFMHKEFLHRAHFLAIEDFGLRWHLDFDQICVDGVRLAWSGIYYRSAEVTPDYEHHLDLEIFEEQLPWIAERVLGSPHFAINNFSKAAQCALTIQEAQRNLETMHLPRAIVVKDHQLNLRTLRKHIGVGVLKGLSCLRTQVIEEKTYKYLSLGAKCQTPTFFQEKLVGDEIRVHAIDGKFFPLLIKKSHSTLDYRYSDESTYSEHVELTRDEITFCKNVVEAENNPLLGIDLIRSKNGTSCFEANPNPGWACFAYSDDTLKKMALMIYEYLSGGAHEQQA